MSLTQQAIARAEMAKADYVRTLCGASLAGLQTTFEALADNYAEAETQDERDAYAAMSKVISAIGVYVYGIDPTK